MNGPQQMKLQRIALRLVNAENTIEKLMAIIYSRWFPNATIEDLAALTTLQGQFEKRKKIGIRTRRSAARTLVSKTSHEGSSPSGCATPPLEDAGLGEESDDGGCSD